MAKLTDIELIEEIRKRVEEKDKALHDLRVITRKLEDVNGKLQESEALKSNFLSNIRNEMINPLTSILLMSDNIASVKGGAGCEECASMGGVIYAEAFNLDFQLRNIFAAAEIEAGEAFPAISNVDAHKLMLGVIDSYRHVANQKKVTFCVDWAIEYTPLNPPVSGGESRGLNGEERFFKTDPEKLRIIVSNLLSNAVKYSHEGSGVMVKAWRHEGRFNILVEDSGIGIDESDHQVIFERFRQLERGTTKSYLGQGLGLSVTKALVELLNGSISVASMKDKGSIFTVFIPEAKPEGEVDVFSEEGNEFIFEDKEKF